MTGFVFEICITICPFEVLALSPFFQAAQPTVLPVVRIPVIRLVIEAIIQPNKETVCTLRPVYVKCVCYAGYVGTNRTKDTTM